MTPLPDSMTRPSLPTPLLAFIHIEKTAGETVKWILRSSFGISHCDISAANVFRPLTPGQLSRVAKIYPALKSIAGHPVTPYLPLEQAVSRPIQFFTFLRDPVKQLASYFQYLAVSLRLMPVDMFDAWIQSEWPQNMQTKRICGEPDAQKAMGMISQKNIYVGLTEDFDESLFLLQQFSAQRLHLGYRRRNQSPDNTLASELLSNARSRALIENIVHEDMALYRWVKDELFPGYRQQYTLRTGESIPSAFPYKNQDFRPGQLLANRLYRNVIYRPLEMLFVRKLPPILNRSVFQAFK